MSPRAWRAAGGAALLLAAAGCGVRRPRLTAGPTSCDEVVDPIGDARPVPNFSHAPDLVRGTARVRDGNITFTIQFAPGTFDRQEARVTIDLDTDRNPLTVIPGDTGLGIDYVVHHWVRSGQTHIEKALHAAPCTAASPCYTNAGMAPLVVLADGLQTTVPLSLLGGADGRMYFRVFTYLSPQMSGGPTIVSDIMPDAGLPPACTPGAVP